jgi:non-heme chloroperoxidase
MPYITTQDKTGILYKDFGSKNAQPIVFSHGWSLSSDDWEYQIPIFTELGYRCIQSLIKSFSCEADLHQNP